MGRDAIEHNKGSVDSFCYNKSVQPHGKEEDKMFPSRKAILKLPII